MGGGSTTAGHRRRPSRHAAQYASPSGAHRSATAAGPGGQRGDEGRGQRIDGKGMRMGRYRETKRSTERQSRT
jgi:hypothetical protein